jgi:hypothetical protein
MTVLMRLAGPGGPQPETGAAQGARLHAEAMAAERAEAAAARSQRVAPIGQPKRAAPPPAVGSTVWRFIGGAWWPATVLAHLETTPGGHVVDAIAAGPVTGSDLVEHRRLPLRVFADRASAAAQPDHDAASAV